MGSVAILVLGIFTRDIAELLLPTPLTAETPLLALARLHYLLSGATIFIVFAAVYLWLTRRDRQVPNELFGKLSFWLMFIGFNAAFLPRSAPGGRPPLLTDPIGLWQTASLGVQFGVMLLLTGIVMSAWHIVLAQRGCRA